MQLYTLIKLKLVKYHKTSITTLIYFLVVLEEITIIKSCKI